MKIKLAALSTLLAINCYATNTIISIPRADLGGFTVIKAEINNNGTLKSTVQNCSSGNYCNITFQGLSITPGVNQINIYAANSNKKIGSTNIVKFAKNNSPEDIYNISLNNTTTHLPKLQTSPAMMNNSADEYKALSIKIGAGFKIIAGVFPAFKGVSDVANGVVELIFGKGTTSSAASNAQLIQAINLIDQVSTQVKNVEDKLTNFYTQYNKDEFEKKTTKVNENLETIRQLTNQVNNNLNLDKGNIINYMNRIYQTKTDKTQSLSVIMELFQTKRDQAEIALNNIIGKNGSSLTNIKQKLDNLTLEQSRDNHKVNYVALNSFYNAEYIKYYTEILAAIASMQQIDTLTAAIISKDSGYSHIYDGHIAIKNKDISANFTMAQNAAIIQSIYAEKIKLLLDKLPINKDVLKDVYGPTGIKFDSPSRFITEGYLDPAKLSSVAGLTINSYDGTMLIGTYGGNSRSNWPTAAEFSIPLQSYQNSTFRVVNDQLIFIPQEARNRGYDGIHVFYDISHSEHKSWWRDDKNNYTRDITNWRKNRFYNSRAFYDVLVYSELKYHNLVRLYEEGNAHLYEWNHPMEVINGNHIRMNRPNYETNVTSKGEVDPRYAIYSVSGGGIAHNTQYLFGIKYGAWGNNFIRTKHCSTGAFGGCDVEWRDEWAWGFRLFCPTLICKQLDDHTLAYPDGTYVVISGDRNSSTINVTRDPKIVNWQKYTITTSFPQKSYNYLFYSPKISGISSGSHNLGPNATDVFYNKDRVVGFKYSYGMQDINMAGQDDTPSFDLKLEDGFCRSYNTKFNKNLKTCVYSKGNNHFEIKTE